MNLIKATVIGVDVDAGVCKCRRESDGETLLDVGFAKPLGDRDACPEIGNRVALWDDGTQLWALFILDRPGIRRTYKTSLGTTSVVTNTGATNTLLGGASLSSGNTEGRMPGDRIIAAKGGSIIAALLGGGVLLRASALSKIIMTKADDLIKIFSRNYERFSDSSSKISVNPLARPYTYEETYDGQENSRAGVASHKVITGDVELGDYNGLEWRNTTPKGLDEELPIASTVLRREAVDTAAGVRKYVENLRRGGEYDRTIHGVDGRYNEEVGTSTSWKMATYRIEDEEPVTENIIDLTPGHLLLSHSSGTGTVSIELGTDGQLTITGSSLTVDVPSTTWNGNISVAEGYDVEVNTSAGVISILKHNHPTTTEGPGAHTHVVNNPVPSPP